MQTNSIFYSDGDKKRARAEMSCARANIPHPDEYARVLCNVITQLSEYASADTVLMYFPTKSEPDLTFLALSALRDGKRLAFPISRPQTVRLISEKCGHSTSLPQELTAYTSRARALHAPL
ncbi:MAG: hypothetical protein J6L85_08560 [Clostridia bacterium]|nr:hypothetical protein [Clostridia bacterium]